MDDDEIQQPLFDHEEMARAATQTAPALEGAVALDEMDDELRAVLTSSDGDTVTPAQRDLIGTRTDAWLETNADPITTDDFAAILQQLKLSVPGIPDVPEPATDDHIYILFRALWTEHRILLAPQRRVFYRVQTEPPRWLMELIGLVDDPTPAKPLPRPPIVQAFTHDGQPGLGRISSSQVSLAIYTACVAFKHEWGQTAKGFPRYTLKLPSGEIVLTLTPEVIVQKDVESQVTAMNAIRDTLSIDDWELLSILMEQVLGSNSSDASAYITDARALDYRKIATKRSKGYSAGHFPVMRASVADSMHRLAHLHVRTDTLQVREAGADGRVRTVPVDWNERVVRVTGDVTRRDTDATLGWHYSFPAWFSTFLAPPNRYVGYLQQETIALHGSKQVAKRLAHYFSLHLRIHGQNSQRLERKASEIFDGARIPINWQRQRRTIDQLETPLRELVQRGLIRIEWNGAILDATSPDLDRWTAVPPSARGRHLLKDYLNQKIVIRADENIEGRYDTELRRRTGKTEPTLGR